MAKKLTEAELKRRARKRKIRKRRFFLFLIFMLIIGVGVFYYFLQTKLFPVKKVAASGSKLYSAQEIVNASGIDNTTPIMTVTESKISARLQKNLPYIETVKVNRAFPDAVKITVTDAKETFSFKNGKEYFVVSESLRALAKSKSFKKGLIKVTLSDCKIKEGAAVEFKNNEEKKLFKLLYSYTKKCKIPLNSINIQNKSNITIYVSGLYEVNLGSSINIKEKIDQLAVMIKEIGKRKGKINLQMWSKTDSKGTFIPAK